MCILCRKYITCSLQDDRILVLRAASKEALSFLNQVKLEELTWEKLVLALNERHLPYKHPGSVHAPIYTHDPTMRSVSYVTLLIRAPAIMEEQESKVSSPHETLEWTKCKQVNDEKFTNTTKALMNPDA